MNVKTRDLQKGCNDVVDEVRATLKVESGHAVTDTARERMAELDALRASLARVTAELDSLRESEGVNRVRCEELSAENDALRAGAGLAQNPILGDACPCCGVRVGDLASVNFKSGKAYCYCAECGTKQYPCVGENAVDIEPEGETKGE